MVYKTILFSWKAASANDPCNLGKQFRETLLSLQTQLILQCLATSHHMINMYEYITKIVL